MKHLIFNSCRFRELFIKKGEPVQPAARAIGISRSSLIGVLSGQRQPKLDMIEALADYVKVSPLDLLEVLEDDWTPEE